MCTVLLPPGDNPIAVNKYIVSYHFACGFSDFDAQSFNVLTKGYLYKQNFFRDVASINIRLELDMNTGDSRNRSCV